MDAHVKELESDIEELRTMLAMAKRSQTKILLTQAITELDKQYKVVSGTISRTFWIDRE
jgi:hypothetical protein